jgi:hypothetical protein
MTDRDSRTRTRARTSGEEDYPPSTAVHWRVTDPTPSGIFVDTNAMHEGRRQTNTGPAHAGSRLKLRDALGRRRPTCHPSSRTGANPPYGMIGGIEETSASFEARSAPRSYPTAGGSTRFHVRCRRRARCQCRRIYELEWLSSLVSPATLVRWSTSGAQTGPGVAAQREGNILFLECELAHICSSYSSRISNAVIVFCRLCE